MRRYAQHRKSLLSTAAVATVGLSAIWLVACSESAAEPSLDQDVPPVFGFGNGAPSGPHYNLNIIGVSRDKTADVNGSSGHVIFVDLWGPNNEASKTTIKLCESGVGGECADIPETEFRVLDKDGTDGQASFALPDPAPEFDPDVADSDIPSIYSVYVRPLGTPGGHADNLTCGIVLVEVLDDAGEPTGEFVEEEVCSVVQLRLDRTKGKQFFVDATRCLLYIYADLPTDDIDGVVRTPIFGEPLVESYWEYSNEGLKLAQFRFYPVPGDVPAPDAVTDCTSKGKGNGNGNP